MKCKMYWAMAAAVAVASFSVPTGLRGADDNSKAPAATPAADAAQPGGDFMLPPGVNAKELKADKGIRNAFMKISEEAVKKDGFAGFCDRLADQDRDRVKKDYKEQKADMLNDVVGKIEGTWKTKYGKDFDFTRAERDKAFSGLVIKTGEIGDPNGLVGNWPLKQPAATATASAASGGDKAQLAASKQDIENAKAHYFGGDVNLEKGREVAVVQVPEAMGMPAVNCSMILEHPDTWRFDIPNNISGQQLHDSLLKHLSMVADHADQWPANVDDAYGMVAHHVVMALYDVQAPIPVK